MNKDTRKWHEFQKRPWKNIDECHSKQSLVVELKEKESELDSKSYLEHNKRKHIINPEPIATIVTKTIQPEDLEEGERLFHSQMWVKRNPLHFIVDRRSQNNLISTEVVKRLEFPKTPHPQPYKIGWLIHGRDLYVNPIVSHVLRHQALQG
jgi:hypothetical protein